MSEGEIGRAEHASPATDTIPRGTALNVVASAKSTQPGLFYMYSACLVLVRTGTLVQYGIIR